MNIKIIGKSVVPDRITLYEDDYGSKHLVFSLEKVNDGVNIEELNGFLEVVGDGGNSDRFMLQKTVADGLVYFTLQVGVSLTETADVLSAQVVFENNEKTISYRTSVFYIDVRYSVDGTSFFEKVTPTVISQLEESMQNSLSEAKTAEANAVLALENIDAILNDKSEEIKSEVKTELESEFTTYIDEKIVIDTEISSTSKNPVQNKVISGALASKQDALISGTNIKTVNGSSLLGSGNIEIEVGSSGMVDNALSLESENPVQNKVITEALDGKLNFPTSEDDMPLGSTLHLLGVATQDLKTQKWCASNPTYIYSVVNNPGNGTVPVIPQYKRAGQAFALSDEGLANRSNTIFVAEPILDYEAANKKYVDKNKGTKLYKHTVSFNIYYDDDGTRRYDSITMAFYSYSRDTESYYLSINDCVVSIENVDAIISPPVCNWGYSYFTTTYGQNYDGDKPCYSFSHTRGDDIGNIETVVEEL